MYHVPSKNNVTLTLTFLNCVFCWILGATYLSTTLNSPSLYSNGNQTFNELGTQIGIHFFNITAYLVYLSMPCLMVGFTSYLLSLLIKKKTFFINAFTFICFFTLNTFFLIDSNVFYLFHFHLNKPLLLLFINNELSQILSLSFYESFAIFILIACLFIAQIVLFKLSRNVKRSNAIKGLFPLWLILFIAYFQMLNISTQQKNNIFSQHLSNLPYALDFYKLIANKQTNDYLNKDNANIERLSNKKNFNYPKKPLYCPQTLTNKPNIILIGIDTLRSDSVNNKIMPNINHFAKESLRFNDHYSGGNATQAGLFSLFYGLPSNYWQAALNTQKAPLLLNQLKEMNYNRKVIWSTNMRHPQVTKTLYLGIENLRLNSAPGNDPILWDKYSTQESINFLRKQKKESPFFLHVFYHSLHAFCRTNSFKTHFTPSNQECRRFNINSKTDPLPFKNRYLNVAKTLDEMIKPLLQEITKTHLLKNTIVIITSDHGQEFNDNKQNYWGHASNYTKEQIKVPLIIHWPNKKARVINYQTTHFDVAPTLLKHALNCKNDFSDHSIGYDLFIDTNKRTLIAGSYVDMAFIKKETITVFKTSGEIEIFNKKQQRLNQKPLIRDMQKFLELTQN